MKLNLKRCVALLGVFLMGTSVLAGCNKKPVEPVDPTDPSTPNQPANPSTPVQPTDPVVTVSLNVTETAMYEGKTVTLTATVTNSADSVVWTSSDTSIATVEGSGKNATITAVKAGKCEVTATVGGVTAKCKVTVVAEPKPSNRLFSINLPSSRLVLNKTGDNASVKVFITDDSVDPAKLEYTIDDEKVCTVENYLNTAYLTAVAKGTCTLTVSYETENDVVTDTCTIEVRNTIKPIEKDPEVLETLDYYVWTAAGVKQEKIYRGLSNAINALKYEEGLGNGSYCTAVGDETNTKLFTLKVYTEGGNAGKAYAYNFVNRSQAYNAFNGIGNIANGVGDWFSGWDTQLKLWSKSDVNMLQLRGQYENSYLYRVTDWDTFGYNADPDERWSGWQATVYSAAGAGVQYTSTSSATAHDISGSENVYSLDGSTMEPSKGTQNVYSEIWTSVNGPNITPTNPADANQKELKKYYGLYFDAGTIESTKDLEDGAKGYWYGFEGLMSHYEGVSNSNPSIRTVDDTPLAYSTWNKQKGCWETSDLQVKLTMTYHFEGVGESKNGIVTIKVSCTQDDNTLEKEYTWDYGESYTLSHEKPFRFSYGVSFTPNAKKMNSSDADSTWAGFLKNAEIPDLYNGGSWKGVKQISCTGFSKQGADLDMSLVVGEAANFRAIWGKDVCSCTKILSNNSTTINFQY